MWQLALYFCGFKSLWLDTYAFGVFDAKILGVISYGWQLGDYARSSLASHPVALALFNPRSFRTAIYIHRPRTLAYSFNLSDKKISQTAPWTNNMHFRCINSTLSLVFFGCHVVPNLHSTSRWFDMNISYVWRHPHYNRLPMVTDLRAMKVPNFDPSTLLADAIDPADCSSEFTSYAYEYSISSICC